MGRHSEGRLIEQFHGSLGVATNNVAEYRGLLAALEFLVGRDLLDARIRSDSELLVRQMRGEYRVKNAGLVPLHRQAASLVSRLRRVIFEHIPRTANAEADRLANLAMDEGTPTREP